MSDNPLHFRHDRAQIFRPLGHGYVHQFLHGPAIREVIVHRADVVETIRMRNKLMIRPVFGEFFHAPMEKAHDHRGFRNPLSFEVQDHFQYAVRRGVLRPHVQQQFLGPQDRQIPGLRMGRIDFIDGFALVFQMRHDVALERFLLPVRRPSPHSENRTYRASLCPVAGNPFATDSLRENHPASGSAACPGGC